MNTGYYITSKGEKVVFEPSHIIHLSGMDLIELVIPNQVNTVFCHNNQLTELIIPDSVEEVYCWNNKLMKLIVPYSVDTINCRTNNLTELIVSDDCVVNCDKSVKVITRTELRSKRLKSILK